ncbi:hypothetical protein RRG08_028970 [Elysia crispata]|uniref:Uncharacterized protein n=1 Tax=Elysia crispata TaxID=231223 RepID=A0AAE1BDC0_9GAST|nr:hypothetical protein RRG08_028970 [Elysia crispata]
MDVFDDYRAFDHPDVASGAFTDDYIPFDNYTPPDATGGSAETSFTTPAGGVVRASDAVGLTPKQQVLATAVDDYYDALLKKGIKPSLGRDINNFELDRGGSLRLKGYPDINIVNTRTSAPNTLDYVAGKMKGGGEIVRRKLGFSDWKTGEGKQELSTAANEELTIENQQMSEADSAIESAPLEDLRPLKALKKIDALCPPSQAPSSTMAWSIVFLVLILFLKSSSGTPILTLNRLEYSKTCSDSYLVRRKDFIFFEFEANSSNPTYPFLNSVLGPQLFSTKKGEILSSLVCNGFDIGNDECIDLSGTPDDHKDFLVAGEDTTDIQFEVSGNNSVHTYGEMDGPQLYYTTTDGVPHKGCMGFDPGTGSCPNSRTVRDACSCEMKNSSKYWLSYTKTATVDTSRATVYLVWPGQPVLRSDNYTFPEIRASTEKKTKHFKTTGVSTVQKGVDKAPVSKDIAGLHLMKEVFIGVGLVVLLATLAVVGVLCKNKYGVAGEIINPGQDQVPSDVRTHMEGEHVKEIEENHREAGDETKNVDTFQKTVSSQTDTHSV